MSYDFTSLIESKIAKFLDQEKKNAPDAQAKKLIERLHQVILRGGKRMRPKLFLMTYVAYGGKHKERLMDLCVALELYHQFLLVYDDLIDGDSMRHNGPNIVGYYIKDRSELENKLAPSMGLLAGDLLYTFSSRIVANIKSLSEKQKITLINTLYKTNIDVSYGELLDSYNIEIESFSESNLIKIHSLKTASYSTKLPMKWAAQILDLSNAEMKLIDNFALSFGIYFQLVDDHLDYFSTSTNIGRDYRQGKITYPLYMALKMADNDKVKFLNQNVGTKDLGKQKMDKIISIMNNCGAKKASQNYLKSFSTRSYAALQKLHIEPNSLRNFEDLIKSYEI